MGVEWPLDLFRRSTRIDVASRARDMASLAVRDRQRLLAAAVREQAGRLLAARRVLEVTNEALTAARRMRDLLDRRVTEGGVPKLEANLAAVEALQIEAAAALAAGEAEAAMIELKAVAGLSSRCAARDHRLARTSRPRRASAAIRRRRPRSRRARTSAKLAARITLADARAAHARQRRPLRHVTGRPAYTRMDFGFAQQGFDDRGVRVPIEGIFHSVTRGRASDDSGLQSQPGRAGVGPG